MLKNKRGFTIIELLVAVVVIGILSTLVIVNFSSVQPQARDKERKIEVETIASYLETEFQKNGKYPSAATMTGSVSGVRTALGNIPASTLAAPGVATGTNSIISFTVAPPTNVTTSNYGYWTPNSGGCNSSYNPATCGTFVLSYKKEVGSTYVYVCGRGLNVNNTKDIFPGPNGMPSFNDTSCSNF